MNLQKAVDLELVYLKNVSESIYLKSFKGCFLQRFPTEVLKNIGYDFSYSKTNSYYDSTGCEIRWCTTTESDSIIMLKTMDSLCNLKVFLNNKLHSCWDIKGGENATIYLKVPKQYSEFLNCNKMPSLFFWRIIFGKGARAVVSSIEVDTQNVIKNYGKRSEWVAYGSSVSHGSGACFITQSFLHMAAEKLGFDILNKAVSSISFVEPEVADFVASQSTNAIVTLELGLNMIGKYPLAVFIERARYLIEATLAYNPSLIVVITPILCHYRFAESNKKKSWNEYSNSLREICEIKYPNIHLIKGEDLVKNIDYLQSDLLHPNNEGHYLMSDTILKQIGGKLSK